LIGSAEKGVACPPPKRPASAAAVSSRPSPSCAWRGCCPRAARSTPPRPLQWAKAALYAGASLLLRRLGIDHVDRVLLAGAFGSYLSPLHAMALGLIPDCELNRVTAVGNAAGNKTHITLLNH